MRISQVFSGRSTTHDSVVHAEPRADPGSDASARNGPAGYPTHSHDALPRRHLSHTVDTIVFADGSSARTDLIRLNPNVHAYSLDFAGIAPHHPSRYRLDTWATLPHLRSRGYEAEVDWILRHSFPMRTTSRTEPPTTPGRLSARTGQHRRTRSDRSDSSRDLAFHQWFGSGHPPADVPVAARRAPGPEITFEFDGEPQLGGYSVWVSSDDTVGLKLQKSINGVVWQDISTSQFTADAGEGH